MLRIATGSPDEVEQRSEVDELLAIFDSCHVAVVLADPLTEGSDCQAGFLA